jgi:hypothetical protein
MVLRPEFSLGHSEFNEFLFASVGEEKNGTQLTVLSALTRLGFDPWGEAARLSGLPKETAARALAAAIALLPEGDWKASDSWSIAARLISRLPRQQASVVLPVEGERLREGKAKPKPDFTKWMVAALIGALLIAMWYLAGR